MNPGRVFVTAAAVAIVALSTLGEGGASALGGTVLHAMVAVAAAVVLAAGVEAQGTRLPAGPLGAFLAFATCAGASAAFAPGAFAAWLVMAEIATFAAVAWLAARCGGLLLRVLPAALAAGLAAHGIFAVAQRWVQSIERPPSTFLNVNHFAAWIVAASLIVASHLAGRARGWPWLAAALVPGAAALALSGSRGAGAGLVAGGAVLLAASWRGIDRKIRTVLSVGFVVFLVAAAGGIALRFRNADPFPYQRAGIGKAALRLAMERPWTGSGPGQFAAAAANLNFPVENAPLRFERVFATPHSDWLRAPAEFGWPAAALLALALVLAFRNVARRWRAGDLAGAPAGAAAALVALAVQGLVDDLSTRPALFVLAATLLGALLAQPRDTAPAPWPRSARAAAALLALLAFALGDLAPYLALREGSPRLNPLSPALWARRAQEIVGSGTVLDLPTYTRAREAAERAVRLDRSDARWLMVLAQVEGRAVREIFRDVAGRERVAGLYARAESLARTNALIPLEAALFLRGSGDPEGARRAAERGLKLEPNAVAPRLLLAACLLDTQAPGSRAQALALVDAAEALATRFAALPKVSLYERRLLVLDPRDAAVLRARAAGAGRP